METSGVPLGSDEEESSGPVGRGVGVGQEKSQRIGQL